MASSATRNSSVSSTAQGIPPRKFRDPYDSHYAVLLDTLRSAENRSGEALRTVGITSAKRREGVTTVACNLALHSACQEMRTLLVDANTVHPGLHTNFHLPRTPGLADLAGEASIPRKAIHDLSSRPFKSLPTSLKNSIRHGMGIPRSARKRENFAPPCLNIMTAGIGKTDDDQFRRSEYEAKQDSERFLEKVRTKFDLVIVDLPAVSELKTCRFSLANLDGVIFVLEAEATSELAAQKGLQQLQQHGANMLGIAFNKYRNHLPRWIQQKLGD
jgi:Mrp family chromosome partitioning ATPase